MARNSNGKTARTKDVGEDTVAGGRVIGCKPKPHVMGEKECDRCERVPKASGVTWKGLYASRRGACTVIEATGGNYAVAQALLRHKTMD